MRACSFLLFQSLLLVWILPWMLGVGPVMSQEDHLRPDASATTRIPQRTQKQTPLQKKRLLQKDHHKTKNQQSRQQQRDRNVSSIAVFLSSSEHFDTANLVIPTTTSTRTRSSSVKAKRWRDHLRGRHHHDHDHRDLEEPTTKLFRGLKQQRPERIYAAGIFNRGASSPFRNQRDKQKDPAEEKGKATSTFEEEESGNPKESSTEKFIFTDTPEEGSTEESSILAPEESSMLAPEESSSIEESSITNTVEESNSTNTTTMALAKLANNTDGGRGFLADYFTELVGAAATAAGVAVGSAGLALILCAAGTICGPVEEAMVKTSLVITLTIDREPTEEELNGNDNALVPLLERFYRNSIAQAFGASIVQNRVLEEDDEIARQVVDGEVDMSTIQVTDFKFTSWSFGPAEESIVGEQSQEVKGALNAAGASSLQKNGFVPDQQVIDLAIQRANLNDFLNNFASKAEPETSVFRRITSISARVTTTAAPSTIPTAPPTLDTRITLYQNDFENPNQTPVIVCEPLDNTNVNTMYGTQANPFAQRFTVETVFVTGSTWSTGVPYNDPTGKGGKYSIGMLSSFEDDRLALLVDTQGKTNINICMDVSSIDVASSICQGPFQIGAVEFGLSLVDSPSGAASVTGTILDSATMSGPAAINQYTFEWTYNTISLDASRATNGMVSVVWNFLGPSGYGTFDNLVIEASNSAAGGGCSLVLSGPVPSPSGSPPTTGPTTGTVTTAPLVEEDEKETNKDEWNFVEEDKKETNDDEWNFGTGPD